MRKITFITLLLLLTALWSFAADFTPTIMKLTAPAEIEYQFDGSELTIPLTVEGTPAATWLVINTKGQAENIVDVQNGYLGWHYVNKIDTTVYISERNERDIGESSIVWDGKDQDGNAAAAGTYDYYLWAYDHKTARLRACDFVQTGFDWGAQFTHIYEKGEDGLPLANPMLMNSIVWWNSNRYNEDAVEGDNPSYKDNGTHSKWVIGNDPHDVTLLQTTRCALYLKESRGDQGDFAYGGPVFDPVDFNTFYHCCVNVPASTNSMLKWQFVTNGEAVLDEDWLGWEELSWEDNGQAIAMWSQKPSAYTDGNYIFVQSPGLHQKELEWNRLRCVSFDGEVIFDKMINDWYYPDDPNPHDYINGAFHLMYARTPNNWFLLSHTCCMHEMIDTTRLIEDADDDTDMVIFKNANGDYFMDSAYAPDVEPAWYCLADDKTTCMRRDSISIDSNGFNVIPVSYLGLLSFGVETQDGTGIGYMSFADETCSDDHDKKGGGILCDGGSNYDGLYMSSVLTTGTMSWYELAQANFIAFDSVGGIITNEPGQIAVEEEAQAAFAVGQNSPNPFNPTTSISFTLPDANQVTVEIYNVAGQKVDTLVNDFMDAGAHSVVWDASGLSAGVYFYTVKSSDFSKTMKMTLLK